ncbi:co-chaperone YbbN [Agilicoccus flavus]|uniref:co-chaperone YbbN n=1 Tax=Agilicoccus flavus TaxID=2775968 RepID=UPI001CF6C364|nr:tetratricopeptide repeat protein [Agilicoccus flavus]
MTQQPKLPPAALRGAVDLSGIGTPPPPPRAPGASGGSGAGAAGIRVDGTDAGFQELVLGSREVPALVVLWSAQHPETEQAVDAAVSVASRLEGRLRVIAVDVQANPGVAQAFQAQQIPMTAGLIAGQPVPLFAGVQPPEQLVPVVDEILKVAEQNGVTGRIPLGDEADQAPEPEPLDPNHEAAFDAIEQGDFDAATRAYEAALKANPADEDARIGLSQVKLMARTAGVDLHEARAKAAAAPGDIDAQLLAADLDLLGGHVEDAFSRLIDVVRVTADEERERVRTHLLELFEVVGTADERVGKARRALMSALF